MIFVLTKRVTHPFLKEPIIQSVEIEAKNLNAALKKLTIYGKHIADLRNKGRAIWRDHKDSKITLTIEEKKESCLPQLKQHKLQHLKCPLWLRPLLALCLWLRPKEPQPQK